MIHKEDKNEQFSMRLTQISSKKQFKVEYLNATFKKMFKDFKKTDQEAENQFQNFDR